MWKARRAYFFSNAAKTMWHNLKKMKSFVRYVREEKLSLLRYMLWVLDF